MMPKFFSHNCPRINVRYVGNHFHRTEFFGLGGFSAESKVRQDPNRTRFQEFLKRFERSKTVERPEPLELNQSGKRLERSAAVELLERFERPVIDLELLNLER